MDGHFVSMTQLICVALLGVDGSIRQIGGPNVVCRLLFMKLFGVRLFPVELLRHHLKVNFLREDLQDYEEMCRARMTTTRVCVYHVDNVEAGKSHSITGECLAHMM